MKNAFARKVTSICAAAILLSTWTGCQRTVILTPTDDDLVVLNGCVVSACNYLAAVTAQHTLDRNFWAKILLVRFENHPAGHAYCVWETDGTIYGYDRNAGAFPIPVYTRDPRSIAIVLAQELSKVLRQPLAVSQADFVNSNEVKLYSFSSLVPVDPQTSMTLLAGADLPSKPGLSFD